MILMLTTCNGNLYCETPIWCIPNEGGYVIPRPLGRGTDSSPLAELFPRSAWETNLVARFSRTAYVHYRICSHAMPKNTKDEIKQVSNRWRECSESYPPSSSSFCASAIRCFSLIVSNRFNASSSFARAFSTSPFFFSILPYSRYE